jgi:hypothetical protein
MSEVKFGQPNPEQVKPIEHQDILNEEQLMLMRTSFHEAIEREDFDLVKERVILEDLLREVTA